MKKIYSFLVVCLLSSMAMGVWAQDLPPGVKFSDGTNENWYNISFKRYTADEKYWLVDHAVSGALINQVLDSNSPNFQWKFELVPGSTNQFYMVNKQSGEYVAAFNAQQLGNFTDSYGMQVPPELLKDDGTPIDRNPPYVNDSYVYYMDANSKDLAAVFEFRYSTAKSGWGIIDTGITGTSHIALNDWAVLAKIIAVWDLDDDGSIVNIDPAGVAVITTSTTDISMGALVDNTTQTTFTVKGRMLNSYITVAVEGPDAAAFKAAPAFFTTASKGGTVTITFSPTEQRVYNATIRVSTPGAVDKLVTLKGEVYQQSDLPVISSEDPSNEHWYYIQFVRTAGSNLVMAKSDNPDDPSVIERVFNGGAPDPKQMWKICGDWEGGYWLVNKAQRQEFLYNTKDTTGIGGNIIINPNIQANATGSGADRYVLPESGYGNLFDLVRFQTTNHWQLRNRDVSAFGNQTSERRYVNEWQNMIHHWDKNDSGNELLFTSADQPVIKTNPAFANMSAPVGQTNTATITVFGLGVTGDINVSVTGAGKDAFQVNPTSLPAEGGNIEITFSNTADSEDNFYTASLTLSTNGAPGVTVPIFGNSGAPVLCTPTQDVWCYLQFQRVVKEKGVPNRVWTGNDFGKNITQSDFVANNYKQQWKLIGTKDGLEIKNRAGGSVFYPKDAAGAVPNNDSHRATVNETQSDLFAVMFAGNVWEFKLLNVDNTPEAWRIGVNDFSQNIIGLWGTDDYGGNAMYFIPVETEAAHNPGVIVDDPVTNLAAQVGETVTAKVNVTGMFLTGNITATLTGDGAFQISPATLPAEGGELTITFTPKDVQGYNTSLVLSNAGMKDVTVPFAGAGAPKFSTAGNDVWYFIQFERNANINSVWTSNGSGWEMAQAQQEDKFTAQQWKFIGDWKSEFVIENRDGGQVYFDKVEDDLGVVNPTGKALIADEGDPMLLVQNGSKWQFQLANFTTVGKSFPNDWCENGDCGGKYGVGLWYGGDSGDFVKFILVGTVGIQYPSVDTDGQVVSMKFYTVQGIEVRQPSVTGVYIVKKIYASGKTQAVKQMIVVK